MESIEERAKEHYPKGIGMFTPEGAELLQKAYIHGATEQRAIDIDRAYEFMYNFKLSNGVAPLYDYVGNLRKALEE